MQQFPWARSQRRSDRRPSLKWLLLPPAIALVLFVGPFQSGTKPTEPLKPQPTASEAGDRPSQPVVGDQIPAMPSALQVVSTLVGVLLLGGVGLVLLRRVQRTAPQAGSYLTVRQTLRLGRHQLHAIEFDQQILLVGECDGGLSVLRSLADPHAAEDEQQVEQRTAGTELAESEGGATPRDLVLPRPPQRRSRQPQPPRPTNLALRDFKALLRRARVETTT